MCPYSFSRVSVVDQQFIEILKRRFIEVMGPLAEIVIEAEIRDMGESPQAFPRCRTADLIRFLSHHIPYLESKLTFLDDMTCEIRQRHTEGYC